MQEHNLKTWLELYSAGRFDSPCFSVQVEAGWYDWFCKDELLANKTKKLAPKVKKVASSSRILSLGLENVYVFFKNNCPLAGSLYDDFRVCDMKSGDVIFCVVPRSGYAKDNGRAELWGRDNEFNEPLVTGNFKDILNYLNS